MKRQFLLLMLVLSPASSAFAEVVQIDWLSRYNLYGTTAEVPIASIGAYKATDTWNNSKENVGLDGVEIDGLWYKVMPETKEAKVIQNKNSTGYRGNIVIPESVEYEGETYCVTSIGEEAFMSCDLTSITIPNSVTTIGEFAFGACHSLTTIVVEDGNAKYDSRNNCNAIIETSSNTLIAGCKNTTIPNSVTTIGKYAFMSCDLTSITIPNSVTSIGASAFYGCYYLTSITIPNSVTTIGKYAFIGVSKRV